MFPEDRAQIVIYKCFNGFKWVSGAVGSGAASWCDGEKVPPGIRGEGGGSSWC